jgi:hypothetical protein
VSAGVTVDEFWALVERSGVITLDKDDRAEWLTQQLAAMPLDAVVDFEVRLTAARGRVDTWLMWDAADYLMRGFCSDDAFFSFQAWLVGLGREAFESVASDPDALAELPEVRALAGRAMAEWDDDWPGWELLNFVAVQAYERATGADGLDDGLADRGLNRVFDPDPDGDRPDDQPAARFPRLAALLA